MTDVLQDWRKYVTVERGLLPNTVNAYERELEALGPKIEVLSVEQLRRRLHRNPGKPATIARRQAAWRSFYAWLVRTDRRADDPTIKLDRPKVRRGLPHPIEDQEVAFEKLGDEARLVAIFLTETGLRISEACSVAVDTIPDELRVRGKGDKERLVPLTDAAKVALEALGGRIPMKPRTVQKHFARAGFTPHMCRHTLATRLARNDVDLSVIQDILGHASPATTRVYQRNDTTRLREGLERR